MSIFQTATDQSADGALTKPALNDLVGEGKKFKSADDLAASKVESDRFIERLQNEQRELRAELAKALAEKEAKTVQPTQMPSVVEPEVNRPPVAPTKAQPADIESEVEKVLRKREYEKAATSNIELVTNRLIEVYGNENKAIEVLRVKSRELEISIEELQKLATDRPKAFFKMIGIDSKDEAPRTTSYPQSRKGAVLKQISSESVVKPGTYAWYQELRRSDPGTFFSPRIQNQMDKDAREKGKAFYS